MRRTLLACTLLIAAVLFPSTVGAAGVRVGSDVTTDTAATAPDNQYYIGGTVAVDGTYERDVFAAGGAVTVAGVVREDVLIVAGETARITGTVEGDVRVFGGTVIVQGTVLGDVVVLGGSVLLTKEAELRGELLAVGARVQVDSTLEKHARIVAASTVIGGTITSSANITTESLTLTDTAVVPGAIVYFSPKEAVRAPAASVAGSVTFNRVESFRDSGALEQAVLTFLNFWMVLRFVTTLLLTFLLVYLFRVFSQRTTEFVLMSFGRSVLTGVLTGIGVLIGSSILFLSLILMPVALLAVLVYICVLIIASAVASIAVGALIKRAFTPGSPLEVSFKTAALGVVLLTLVQFVPLVGEATNLIFFVAAFGAVWRYVYEHIRWRELSLFEKK